jgi:hypothetical protein
MTLEEMKTEKLNTMIEAAQDCEHHTSFEDLERKLNWLEFTINELLCFASTEEQMRQDGEGAFMEASSGGATPLI